LEKKLYQIFEMLGYDFQNQQMIISGASPPIIDIAE